MSEGINQATLVGHLGSDPELRATKDGTSVLSIRMATTSYWQDSKTRERKERTEWHSVVVWGKRADALHQMLVKGTRVYIQGELQTRSWEDKTGSKRYTTEVRADKVIILSGGTPRDETKQTSRDEPQTPAYNDDDIPF